MAVHGPGPHTPGDRPVSPSIVQASTFEFSSIDSLRRYNETGAGHMYTRYGNPTVEEAERVLAALEGAQRALVFSSGMAATSAIYLSLVKPGETIVSMRSVYGGSFALLSRDLPSLGIATALLEGFELDDLENRVPPRAKILHLETPTNPVLEIVDIEDLCRRAHALGMLVVVDNTFATPVLQNPLALGADVVMHSASKYLSGHSDVTAGVVAGSAEVLGKIEGARRGFGGCADPFAAWLLLRGLRTLTLRVEAQSRGAGEIASRLEGHPAVARVLYPGLPGHPGHAVAKRQMRAGGGIVTLELAGGLPAAEAMFNALRLVLRAASLGSVESLASIPVYTSHAGFTAEDLAKARVSPGMIRLSVGIEDPADLIADLEGALPAAG